MSLIAYHPPKTASHGHGSRARKPRKAWETVQEFLQGQTVAEIQDSLKLTTYGPSQWTDASVVEEVRRKAAEIFGPATSESGMFLNWQLPVCRLEEALEFVFAGAARPKQAVEPVSLYVSYSFSWKALENLSAPHPLFQRGNWLGVHVEARRVFIQPTFLFVVPSDRSAFVEQVRQLEAAMPFTPKDDYYYRVEAKASGGGDKLVRLKPGWKDA